jgi:hypothetical protein
MHIDKTSFHMNTIDLHIHSEIKGKDVVLGGPQARIENRKIMGK